MSANKASFVVLTMLCVLAVLYFMAADALPEQQTGGPVGSGYFPKLLAVLLMMLCVGSIFQTFKKEDKKIPIPNVKLMLLTLGLTILYLWSWNNIGFFYVNTFLYLFALLTFYKRSRSHIWIHIAVALTMTAFIYVVFGRLLYIQF